MVKAMLILRKLNDEVIIIEVGGGGGGGGGVHDQINVTSNNLQRGSNPGQAQRRWSKSLHSRKGKMRERMA